MSTKHCTRCGFATSEEALFCSQCGNGLHRADQDPLIGQTIAGRYYLTDRIGQGGAGTLYKAEHVTLRRRMALKLLHNQLSLNEGAVERFRREAITVCEIDNDHILQVHDFGRAEDGRLFFAMEYLEGEPLSALLEREGALSVDRGLDILTQLVDALMEAHALGYVHRDLRPRNVFLTRRRGRSDFVKLLDFGLAKLVLPDIDAAKTNMGMTFGDPHYMAPEQARGDVVDRRADIYSLGAIAYEMLTGQPPYRGAGTFDVLSKVLDAPVPRIRDRRVDCPEWLEAVVRVALAKAPPDRFATVAQMLEALERKQPLERQPPFALQVSPAQEQLAAIQQMQPMSQAPSASTPPRVTRAYEAIRLDAPPDGGAGKLSRKERRQQEQERRDKERVTRTDAPSGELADRKAREEEARKRAEDAAREAAQLEAWQRAEEAKRKADEEARRHAEEAKRKAEEEARRQAEAKQRAEEEARKQAEEAKRRAEEEARKQAEEAKRTAEEEARALAEAKRTAEEEARKQADEEARALAEAKRTAEEAAKRKLEEEARKQAEEEAKQKTDERDARQRATDEIERKTREAAERAKEAASRIMQQTQAKAQRGAANRETLREPLPRIQLDRDSIAREAAAWEEAAQSLLATVPDEPVRADEPAVTAPATAQLAPMVPPQDDDATRPTPLLLSVDEGEVGRGDEAPPPGDLTVPVLKATGEHEVEWFNSDVSAPDRGSAQPAFAVDDEYEPDRRKRMPALIGGITAVAALVLILGAVFVSRMSRSTQGEASTSPGAAPEQPKAPEAPSAPQVVPPKAPEPAASEPASTAPVVAPPVAAPIEAPKAAAKEPGKEPPAVVAQPVVEAPKPKAEPVVEAPKTAPKVEPPKAEPPKPAAAKAEAPKAAAPKAEPPKAEPPKPAAAKAEAPKTAPKAEPPRAEPVKVAAAKAEAPKAAPKAEPPKAEPVKVAAAPVVKKTPEPPKAEPPAPAAEKKGGAAEAEELIRTGRAKLQGGDVGAAASSFAKAREIEPRNAEAIAGLGEVAFEQGSWDEAVGHLKKAVKLAPRRVTYQVLLGQSLYKLGKYQEAADACRKALKQEPGSREAQQTLDLAEKKLADASE